MSLIKELGDEKTMITVVSSEDFSKEVLNTVKEASKHSVCYVTLNKTFDALNESFSKKGVNMENLVFIDAISKSIQKKPNQSKNVYYVSSPGSLTELSLVISKFLRHEFKYLIFDSISNLTVYNKKNVVIKFLLDLSNKVKKSKTQAILFAVKSKENEGMINQCSLFVDKVVKYEKN